VGVALFWGALLLYYHTGASGVRIEGASVDFGRGADYQLYRITDRMALQVNADQTSAIVEYQRGIAPLTLLCGTYENNGTTLVRARLAGDWLYGIPVEQLQSEGWRKVPRAGVAAVNLATGETISVAKQSLDPSQKWPLPPELVARGWSEEAGVKANAKALVGRLEKLSTSNESCENFNVAFLLVAVALVLLLPFLLWFKRRQVAA
jgi:hypothetical protein